MSLDPDRSNAILADVRDRKWDHCVAVGSHNPHGLQLKFRPWGENGVEAEFDCRDWTQGYDGLVHGGILCTLLDAASVNCLFIHEITAVTAALDARFHHPVKIGIQAIARAWLVRSVHQLLFVSAELEQEGRVCVSSSAKFMLPHG